MKAKRKQTMRGSQKVGRDCRAREAAQIEPADEESTDNGDDDSLQR